MEWLLFFVFFISLGIYIKKEQVKKGVSLNFGSKSLEFKDYERTVFNKIKAGNENEIKSEYYQKAKEHIYTKHSNNRCYYFRRYSSYR